MNQPPPEQPEASATDRILLEAISPFSATSQFRDAWVATALPLMTDYLAAVRCGIDTAKAELASARAELASARADKARLDWLDGKAYAIRFLREGDAVDYIIKRDDSLRSAIDATRHVIDAAMTASATRKAETS